MLADFFFFLALLTVLVQCSCLHFRTIAKRALFYKDELVDPDELFLGTGCLAIHVRADELEFDYPVTLCGIEIQVRETTVLPSIICKNFETASLRLFLL